jgi:DNA-directed RNA polymerase subunit RPC12/RpoP
LIFIKEVAPIYYLFDGKKKKRRMGLYKCELCGKEFVRQIKKSQLNRVCRACAGTKRMLHGAKRFNKTDRLYRIWLGMKYRCYNKSSKDYDNYGGRGITIIEEWKDNFINFRTWAINNGYTDSLTIDRVNVNEGYSPDNCRWVTLKEQEVYLIMGENNCGFPV